MIKRAEQFGVGEEMGLFQSTKVKKNKRKKNE